MKTNEEKAAYQRAYRAAHPEEYRAYTKAYRETHREECNSRHRARGAAGKLANIASKMKCTHGITLADFDRMLAAQKGVCKICGGTNPIGKRLAIDHNHDTGMIRGLLCGTCNTGLGMFKDDPALLREAKKYLDESTT